MTSTVGLGLALLSCGPGAAPPTAPTGAPTEPVASAEATAEAERDEPPLELVEVAPGVLAALQPATRRFADSNAAILVGEAGAVVIDGPQQVAAARWLHQQVSARTSGPQRELIGTHWHLDHSLGVTVLRAAFEADGLAPRHWGHAGLAEALRARGREQLQEHRAELPSWLERGEAMRESGTRGDGTRLTPPQRAQLEDELVSIRAQLDAVGSLSLAEPTHPVSEPTRLELGEQVIELRPIRAHTDADLVVYLPRAKVLITGDVLDEIPFGGHGHPRQWLEALQDLARLEVETIIPGHGRPMGPEALALAIELWTAILEQAELAVANGETAAERWSAWEPTEEQQRLRARLVSDPVSERAHAAFVPESLARAVAERRGEI